MGELKLHKPIFIIVDTELASEVSAIAETLLDRLISDGGSHDWYQGIKKSGRWSDEYNHFDTPRLFDSPKSKELIKYFLKSQKKEILDWIKLGNKELLDKTKEFSWALTNFSIGAGSTPIHLFDMTSWSEGNGILDRQTIKGMKKHSDKLWIKGYDIHY